MALESTSNKKLQNSIVLVKITTQNVIRTLNNVIFFKHIFRKIIAIIEKNHFPNFKG